MTDELKLTEGRLSEAVDVFTRLQNGEEIPVAQWTLTSGDGRVYNGTNGVLKMGQPPVCGPEPRFKVGDRVAVRYIWDGMTSRGLMDKVGVVEEVESLPDPLPFMLAIQSGVQRAVQHNYQVRLDY